MLSVRSSASLALVSVCLLVPRLEAQSAFVRGDANADGAFDLSDPVFVLGYLFLGASRPQCLDACDANDDGALEITDAIQALSFLFLGGPPPAAPFPECGLDSTPSATLGCASFSESVCPGGLPPSRVVELLEDLTFPPTEPCCFPGLGTFAVRAGRCPTDPAAAPACAEAQGPADRLAWRRLPPGTLLDGTFTVEVLATGGLEPGRDFDLLTLDIFAYGEDGSLLGPGRIGSLRFSEAASPQAERTFAFTVDATAISIGPWMLRATAWRLDASGGEELVRTIGDEDSRPEPPVIDEPVALVELPAPFRVGPTAAETLPPHGVATLLAAGFADEPDLEALVSNLSAAEIELRAFEATIASPEIESLGRRIREENAEKAAAEAGAADARDRADVLRERIAEVERALAALAELNRWLDEYFGPEDLARIAEQIRRRAAILGGAGASDPAELAEALTKKRARLAEVSAELPAKRTELDDLKKKHAAQKDAIRAQFHKTRRTLGDNMGRIEVRDDGVSYDIVGLLVSSDGSSVIKYAPFGDKYNAEKEKLDAMIRELEDLWRRIRECEELIRTLEAEKAALEENVDRLANGADEVEETDRILDEWFARALSGLAPHAPHLAALLARLEWLGEGRFADWLRAILVPVPRTPEEFERFREALDRLRAEKHAREAELRGELEDAKARAEAEEAAAAEAERRAREAADRRKALEEELRRAEEEARRAAEEEYRRARAAAEDAAKRKRADAERRARLRDLRDRAREGDEDAMRELAELIGLSLLDEVGGKLRLGSIVGAILAAKEFPECACRILGKMKDLFLQNEDWTRLGAANDLIREIRECANLLGLATIEPGADALAGYVKSVSKEKRLKMAAVLQRALEIHGCP